MIMAIQSEGYTCFPMRSMNSMKDSIRKSCSRQEGLKTFAGLCVYVGVGVALTIRSKVLVKVSMYVA